MSILARIFLAFIRLYQFTLSAVMGKSCRFYPSCSHYTADSIRRFGALKGAVSGLLRLSRCHPWNPGGHDPVPEMWQNPFGSSRCCDKKPLNPREGKTAE